MGIIVKQLIFNTMLENNNKIVGNNQQTESEAKLVSNTLNPESMEDKDTLKRELEGNNMEINNLKNSTMKISLEELINEFDLSATIKSLYQELKKAKEKLAQAKENRQKNALRKVARAKKALKEELQKNLLPTPIEKWKPKEEEGKLVIERKIEMVILGYAPSIINLSTTNDKLAMDIVNDDLLEKDSTKYLATADIFYQENIELRDLNGNIIPANTADVCYMLGSVKDQRIIQAIHKLNIDALVEGTDLRIIKNIQKREFTSIKELAKYCSTNTLLDRSLKGKEKLSLAVLATEDEFIKKISETCASEKMPASTAIKYYNLGKRFTNTELCNAARGILTGEFKYDLSCGDKIIAVLHELNFGEEIKKRYIIDAFASFTNLQNEKEEPYGFHTALEALRAFNTSDIKIIQATKTDKVNLIVSRLTARIPKEEMKA